MTDFGGAGHGGTVAECELNLTPEKSVAGSATLTSSDLNELGCTSSTSAKSTTSSSGISSAKSEERNNHYRHYRRSSSTSQIPSGSSVRSGSLLNLFRKSRSTHKPPPTVRSRSTAATLEHEKAANAKTRENAAKQRNQQQQRARSSSRIFADLLRTLTSGFANCSRKANNEDQHSRRGSNSCSNSDALSNNHLDLLGNQYPNSQSRLSRRKSHDGSHDGTNGSDSTSTGYVSDSSNEKHYPKNNNNNSTASSKPSSGVVTVATISAQVDETEAEKRIATAWSDAIKAAATIRPLYESKEVQKPPKPPELLTAELTPSEPTAGSPHEDENVPTSTSLNPSANHSYELNNNNNNNGSYELNTNGAFCYVASSASEEEVTGTEDSLYTTGTESGSSDYETNETSSYEEETDEKELKATKRNHGLDIIKEEDEEETTQVKNKVKRRKSTLKRKRTLKGQDDLKSGAKSTLTSLKAKEEDAVSRTGSLKDMILQFETAMAALEIQENRTDLTDPTGKDNDARSPLQGVKAIAQKIQEQSLLESQEVEQMPPSQMLKLKQALELTPRANVKQALELTPENNLAAPIPLSRRSESKVAQIARQLAEAERQRVKMEKAAAKNGGKSPKALKKQSSTNFINELLEMARAESVDKLNESDNHEAAPDFKQSLLAARKKITQREEEVKQSLNSSTPLPLHNPTVSASSLSSEGGSESGHSASGPRGLNEEIDPFVKEVLKSKTVPEPVKQKIRIECWSLFNDPRTPKGVKQCILATMLSKVQNE